MTHRWNLPQFVVQAIAAQGTSVEAEASSLDTRIITTVVSWLKSRDEEPLADLVKLHLGDELGLTELELEGIEVDFLQQKKEIESIARMLAR